MVSLATRGRGEGAEPQYEEALLGRGDLLTGPPDRGPRVDQLFQQAGISVMEAGCVSVPLALLHVCVPWYV